MSSTTTPDPLAGLDPQLRAAIEAFVIAEVARQLAANRDIDAFAAALTKRMAQEFAEPVEPPKETE